MTVHIEIAGVVQGVGFRPFLHRLLYVYLFSGWARNTSAGIEGCIAASPEELEGFLSELQNSPPPMAQIDAVRTEPCAKERTKDAGAPVASSAIDTAGAGHFVIRESRIKPGMTLIPPDTAMCPECEAELYTPTDRRYRYPFINCTNCGPRYTIIESLPYDRERTVMEEFPMCPDCEREYRDITDRRYHAQPDCCPDCGPKVFYFESRSEKSGTAEGDDAFRDAQRLLAAGGILAVKGIGGVHLSCSALDSSAVRRLRERKRRAEKPLALMCRSLDCVRKICEVTPEEEHLLTSAARPIVLLAKKEPSSFRDISFSRRIGVMLPYTPLHTLLLDGAFGGPDILVMTSGNLSGCPVLTENESAVPALENIADGFLLHNRRIANRCDDSLIAEWKEQPYFFRRSRGYAPAPLSVGKSHPENVNGICAMGAEQKASFALGRDTHVFLSPFIGDLKNAETFEHYTTAVQTYRRLFKVKPELVVCDLHPDYLSSREAARMSLDEGIPLLKVQHHWAHMASCMADNHLDEPCFGIIWDGTGLGTDGTIWGGEFLIGDFLGFKRAGSLRPVLLPGGDRAIREIGRLALALYDDAFEGAQKGAPEDAASYVPLPKEKCDMLQELLHGPYSAGLSPSASSIGRLFDGVCSFLLKRASTDYEGEGAALVEALLPAETPEESGMSPEAFFCEGCSYPVAFYSKDDIRFFDTRPMVRALVGDLEDKTDSGRIALKFMCTLIRMAADQCRTLNPGKLPVLLSGGVFQNRFLLHGLTSVLEAEGYNVYTHHGVSTNDEGICLGQLAIAWKKRSMKHVFSNADED